MNFSHGGDLLHEAIFQAWRCVVGSAPVIYLSGPITTGRRFVEAVALGQPLETVLTENLAALAAAAADLRLAASNLVIDPSPLVVAHWSQDQYMLLWKGLIERHALEVRFMPDWEYSLGCTMEFVHAAQLDIPARTLVGDSISVAEGRLRIEAAIAGLEEARVRDKRLADLRTGLAAQLQQISP